MNSSLWSNLLRKTATTTTYFTTTYFPDEEESQCKKKKKKISKCKQNEPRSWCELFSTILMRVIFIWKRLVCLLFLKPIIRPYWESWQRSFLGQQMQSKDYIRFFPLYFFWICLKMNLVLGPLHARISWCFVSVHPYMTIFLVCYYNIYNTAIIFPGINISDW